MKNMLVYPLLWGRERNKTSVILENGFGTKCKDGKRDYCHKVEEKF